MLIYIKHNLQDIPIEKQQNLLGYSLDSLVLKLKSSKILPIYEVNVYNGP